MKTTNLIREIGIIILGVFCLLSAFAAGESQAAVAHVRASAEVIDPAVIDCSKILANAAAEAAGKTADSAAAQQAQPEVKVVTVEGVTWLSIDYN
jgi:hypothetical protein